MNASCKDLEYAQTNTSSFSAVLTVPGGALPSNGEHKFSAHFFQTEFPAMKALTLLGLAGVALGYDRAAAVAYARQYALKPNHRCGADYTACTPWSYWGNEACDYSGNGGDCANFVSQSILAGGHSPLNSGYPCRGYPCGKEEIGARHLAAVRAIRSTEHIGADAEEVSDRVGEEA